MHMVMMNAPHMISRIDLSVWQVTARDRETRTHRGEVRALLQVWDGSYWVQLDYEALPLRVVTVCPPEDPQAALGGESEDDETRMAEILQTLGLGSWASAAQAVDADAPGTDPAAPPQSRMMRSTLFPELEEACRAALREVDGQADVMVLPDGNFPGLEKAKAICLKSPLSIRTCHTALDALEGNDAHNDVDFTVLKARVGTDLIVIGAAVARNLDSWVKGVLWHEYGHVLYGPGESDSVFAFEVGCILAKFGRDEAREWVMRRPIGYYAATLARTGSESRLFTDLVRQLLTPEEHAEFERLVRGSETGTARPPRSGPRA
jgi:hypothetical protein